MSPDPYSRESLRKAESTIQKCLQPRVVLPDVKSRTPSRDAPYHQHHMDAWASFEKMRTIPIPPQVFDGIKGSSPTATQALFPEIERACITVDNKLYLWNYIQGQSAFEFYHLQQDEIILSVGLVPARAGVFIDEIQHVLVLSTGIHAQEGRCLILLGLQVTCTHHQSEIKLYETGMTVNTNGVVLSEIKGTSGGRVFASGSDQCLYELVYQANEGWFSNKCYLRNITSPRFSNFLPTFIKAEKRLDCIAVDDARNLVYTLRQGSLIEVFHLPSKDATSAPVKAGSTSGVTQQVGLTHSQQDVGHIVWIGPTERDPRSNTTLVALTERGHRIYLEDFQGRTWAPLQVRAPPALQQPQTNTSSFGSSTMTTSSTLANRSVSSVLYAGDVIMVGFKYSAAPGQVCCITPGPTGPSSSGTPTESATFINLELALSAPVIAEAKQAKPAPQITEAGELVRQTVAQTLRPPRTFLILDNNGLTEVMERRPIDLLRGMLESGTAINSAVLMEFFGMYGSVESCQTALAIAARNSQVTAPRITIGSQSQSTHVVNQALLEQVMSQASRIFFSQYGSWPADARMPAALSSPRTSRHDGLAFYVGCLLKRVWERRIVPPVRSKPTSKSSSTTSSNFKSLAASLMPLLPLTLRDLQDCLEDLVPLVEFLQNNSKLFGFSGTSVSRTFLNSSSIDFDQERAAKLDHESFERIKALTSRTIEALNFMLFLMDHGIEPLINACSADAKKILSTLCFGQLVTTRDGKQVSKELVNALIEARIGAQISIDAVADALQARCGSFCSADDVRQYKATECIRKAKETKSEKERIDHLRMSLKLLARGANQLSTDKLKKVCDDYRNLGFATGVVDLALGCALEWDRAGMAISYRAEGCPEDASHSESKQVYDKRKQAYQLVFDALKELDDQLDAAYNVQETEAEVRVLIHQRDKLRSDAYARAQASDDPLFHEQLYQWLIERKLTDQLLSLKTRYLEEYLQGQPGGVKGKDTDYIRTLRNLLWQYYVRNNEWFAAAQVLDALAHSKEFGLELKERIEYLALAVGNAKSVGPSQAGSGDVVSFLSQVEEDLEVAQIQAKVLHSLHELKPEDLDDSRRSLLTESIEWLDDELVDLSTLFKNFAEPFDLLEEQLLIISSADYQDLSLVAEIWTLLITREHQQTSPQQAFKAIGSLVQDLLTRLGRSETACPIDIILDLLLRYSFEQQQHDHHQGVENPVPSTWAPLDRHRTTTSGDGGNGDTFSPIPIGWSTSTLLFSLSSSSTTSGPSYLFHLLQSFIKTAPPPWNSSKGQSFLYDELIEFLSIWIPSSTSSSSSSSTLDSSTVQKLFDTIHSMIVSISSSHIIVKDSKGSIQKLHRCIELLKLFY